LVVERVGLPHNTRSNRFNQRIVRSHIARSVAISSILVCDLQCYNEEINKQSKRNNPAGAIKPTRLYFSFKFYLPKPFGMRIAITGTPGVGKTTVAKLLAQELDFDYIDLNKLAEDKDLITGTDVRRNAKIINIKALPTLQLPKNCVIDGHLSQYCKADLVIVLRCDPRELRKRLAQKRWGLPKVKENLEAEALGVIALEARDLNPETYEMDVTKILPQYTAEAIVEMVKGGERKGYKPHIDYSERVTEVKRVVFD
jgi:adenylate kinase